MTLNGAPVTNHELYELAAKVKDGRARSDANGYAVACWAIANCDRLTRARRAKLAAEAEAERLRAEVRRAWADVARLREALTARAAA